MNDLYYPQKPKSKLEEYNQKLKERELYTNNILDRFIENGSGAPRHDKYGNLSVKKKTAFKDEYEEDILLPQDNNAPSFQINENNSNNNNLYNTMTYSNKSNQGQIQNNISENINTNPRFYQSFSNRRGNLNIDNINNNEQNNLNEDIVNQSYDNSNNNNANALNQNQLIQKNQNNNYNNNQNFSNINSNRKISNYSNQNENSTNYSNISYNNINRRTNGNNDPYRNNYQGLGILPGQSSESKREKMIREEAFKETLRREMEEKKIQKELEKQKEKELDLKAELKLQKELEEEKQQVLLEKQKKGELEQKMMEENRIRMQKSKKKKNLIDIDEYYNKNLILKNHRAYIVDNKTKNKRQNINDNNSNIDNSNNENSDNPTQNNVYFNIDRNYRNNLNALQNIRNIKEETLNNINNFNVNTNIDNQKNNDIDNEIFQLKNEVRNQYMEMNDLFDQLKYGITEAEQYKKGRENESKILKEELFKNRTAQKLSNNILERDYEKNMNLNYDELVSNNNINTIDSNTNLQGKSQWEYINKEENENKNDLSSLAKAGKNIIELTGENDFIPISNNVANGDDAMNGLDINKIDLMNEERKIEEDNDKKGIMQFKREMEIENILNENSGKGCTMEDLYKELNIIQNINHDLSPISKIETLKNNFDVDYGIIKNKEKKMLKSKFKK